MVFDIKNKVALVTGGASGIGLALVKNLLKHEAKGVAIADINSENGEKVVRDLVSEYGESRIFFVKTDVSDYNSFENAFKVTLQHFKNVDILFNNAGVGYEDQYDKLIDINLKGPIYGALLGLDKYLRYHKQGEEAVILNTSSVAPIMESIGAVPIYTASKAGILGMTKSWGEPFHYERTKVRMITMCPGLTETNIIDQISNHLVSPEYSLLLKSTISKNLPHIQSVEKVAEEAIRLIEKAPHGTIWVIEDSQPAYQYIVPDKGNFKNNILK